MSVILITILLEIIIFGLVIFVCYVEDETNSDLCKILATILICALFVLPPSIGKFHGYIDYKESNDKDLARITAVTQEQTFYKTYYIVEVEYLTNTANGVLQTKSIEKDYFYVDYDNRDLAEEAKNNLYQEVWIISGYKGGYENVFTYGNHLLKEIQKKGE